MRPNRKKRSSPSRLSPLFLIGLAAVGAGAQAPGPIGASAPIALQADSAGAAALPSDPASGAGNTAAPSAPDEVKLIARGAFSTPSARVGDSLDYILAAEWEDTQVPVVVLAPDSAEFPGFRILGQSTQHRKTSDGNAVRNRTEFIYQLRAATQGPGKARSLKLRYLTGLSRQEEAVFVPSALLDIGPAPRNLMDMLWVKLLLGLALMGGAGALGWAGFRLASRKRAAAKPARADLKPEIEALKSRLRSAHANPDAGKAILAEMETVATRHLRDESGGAPEGARFETLLDSYLSKGGGGAADWEKLRELFRHARFAGGYKEPHELQDAFRTLRKCLKMQAEDEP